MGRKGGVGKQKRTRKDDSSKGVSAAEGEKSKRQKGVGGNIDGDKGCTNVRRRMDEV